MTNIGANLNLIPLSKMTPQNGALSLPGNKSGAVLPGAGNAHTNAGDGSASFFSMLEKMPETMQKVAHAIAAKTESDLNHDDALALKIFLARMQKELGVKPDQIVQAFSKMSVHDMALPPEATADKFVSELKLNHKDEKKARDLYSKLLGILSTTDLMKRRVARLSHAMDQNFSYLEGKKTAEASSLAQKPMGADQNANDEKVQTKSNNHKVLETLGATAALATAAAKGASSAKSGTAAAVNASAKAASTAADKVAVQSSPNPIAAKPADQSIGATVKSAVANPLKPARSDLAASTNAPNVAASPQLANEAAKPTLPFQSPQQAPIHAPALAKALAANPVHVEAATTPTISTAAIATGAAAAAHMKSSGLSAYNQQSGSPGDGKQDKQNDAQVPVMVDSAVTQKPDSLTAVQTQAAKGGDAKVAQNNIQELISHAQFLAHKGGGEMKVSLKPDGLGEVQLNVKMHKGQMSVQMLASNEDAKNVLQKGLGELKTSLAAHHIHVDSIRVDSPMDMVGQFLHQRHQQMEQNFQRRFLSNFQQRNESNRQAMFDFGDPEIPFNQVTDRASNARYGVTSNGRKSSRRLDLVA